MGWHRYYSFGAAWRLGWSSLLKAWLPLFVISQCATLPGPFLDLVFDEDIEKYAETSEAADPTGIARLILYTLAVAFVVDIPLLYGGIYAASRSGMARFEIRDLFVCYRRFGSHVLASVVTSLLALATFAGGLVLIEVWFWIARLPADPADLAWKDLRYLLLGLVPISIGLGCVVVGYAFVPLAAVDPGPGRTGLSAALARNWEATSGRRYSLFWFFTITLLLSALPSLALLYVHISDPFTIFLAIEAWMPPETACFVLGNMLSGPFRFAMWGAAYRLVIADSSMDRIY